MLGPAQNYTPALVPLIRRFLLLMSDSSNPNAKPKRPRPEREQIAASETDDESSSALPTDSSIAERVVERNKDKPPMHLQGSYGGPQVGRGMGKGRSTTHSSGPVFNNWKRTYSKREDPVNNRYFRTNQPNYRNRNQQQQNFSRSNRRQQNFSRSNQRQQNFSRSNQRQQNQNQHHNNFYYRCMYPIS